MEYTISVVGNANTGKTALIHRFMIGVWPKNYKKTIDVGYYSRIVNTNRGKIRLNVIDAPTEEHISESDGFVVCYDYNDANTKNPLVFSFINNAEKPLVVCATKYADLNNIHAEDEEDIPVDSWRNYNIELPFLHLLRKIMDDESVEIIDSDSEFPPEVNIELSLIFS